MSDTQPSQSGKMLGSGGKASASEGKTIGTASERVRSINQTIANIQAVKRYLQLNSVEVKSSIHSSISRLLEALRTREVWLLNHVDVIYQAKEAVLRLQEDRLNQIVGGLNSCIDLVETGAASEADLWAYLENIGSVEQHAAETPHITFRADMPALRDSIQKFGRVDSKGLSLLGGPFTLPGPQMGQSSMEGGSQGGSSLPRQFEDYGDDEHQVLYKTVGDMETCIKFTIPRLADARTTTALHSACNPTKPAPLRESKSVSVLENLLGHESGLSGSNLLGGQENRLHRGSSLRQWLSDITTQDCEDDSLTGMGDLVDSGLADMISERQALANATAMPSPSSSNIEIRITAPDEEYEAVLGGAYNSEVRGAYNCGMEGAYNTVEAGSKVELFESFRRICQRPLSDWLSRACAVIDRQSEQSQAAAELRYTLTTFHRVINSPISDWLHIATPPHSGPSFPWNHVDKQVNSRASTEERTENKWLLGRNKTTELSENLSKIDENRKVTEMKNIGEKVEVANKDMEQDGDELRMNSEREQEAFRLRSQNTEEQQMRMIDNYVTKVLCPISSYVTWLSQQPIGQFLAGGKVFESSGMTLNAENNPMNGYLQHCSTLPQSHWLLPGCYCQDVKSPESGVDLNSCDPATDAYNPLKDYLQHCAALPQSHWLLPSENMEQEAKTQYNTKENQCSGNGCTNTVSQYNIGASVAFTPIQYWLEQTSRSSDLLSRSSPISSTLSSDWAIVSANRSPASVEESDPDAHWLAGEVALENSGREVNQCDDGSKHPALPEECLRGSVAGIPSSVPIPSGVQKSFSTLWNTTMFELNNELDDCIESFVAIGQDHLYPASSASTILPPAFSQPMNHWIPQEGHECCPIATSHVEIGRSVLDRFALMEVSDWLQ